MSELDGDSRLRLAKLEMSKALDRHLPQRGRLDVKFQDTETAEIEDGFDGCYCISYTGAAPLQPQVNCPVRHVMDCIIDCLGRDEEQADRMQSRVFNMLRISFVPDKFLISPWTTSQFYDKRDQVHVNRITVPMKIVA